MASDGVIDYSVVGAGASIWRSTATGQNVTIDLQQQYPLTALIYVAGAKSTEVTACRIQVSTGGSTWTNVAPANSPIPPMSVRPVDQFVREPRVIPFKQDGSDVTINA